MNTTALVSDYVKILLKQQAIREQFKQKMKTLDQFKEVIENKMLAVGDPMEVPEEVMEHAPFMAWKLGPKDDATLIQAHMQIDDVLIPQLTKSIEAEIALLKQQKEDLETFALQVLRERKLSNFGVTGVGRVENRVNTKYNIADKALFVDWAVKNKCESELSITLRQNSKFMAQVIENEGEVPPGVSTFREHRAIFVKA